MERFYLKDLENAYESFQELRASLTALGFNELAYYQDYSEQLGKQYNSFYEDDEGSVLIRCVEKPDFVKEYYSDKISIYLENNIQGYVFFSHINEETINRFEKLLNTTHFKQ